MNSCFVNIYNFAVPMGEAKGKVLVAHSCPTLCDLIDCSLPDSSVHRIQQVRMLEWVAISFSRGSPQPMDQTRVFWIGRWILYHWTTREPQKLCYFLVKISLLLHYLYGTNLQYFLYHITKRNRHWAFLCVFLIGCIFSSSLPCLFTFRVEFIAVKFK